MNELVMFGQSTYEMGELFGQIIVFCFVGFFAAYGMWICRKIMRRPETHTLCVVALMFFLAFWLLGIVTRALVEVNGGTYTAVTMLLSLLQCMLLLSSMIIGIIGWIDYGRNSDRYVQGRSQAGWSVGLSAVVLLGIVGVFLNAVQKRMPQEIESEISDTGTIDFPEINVRFKAPPKPWVEFDVKKMNSVASVGFKRTRPEIYMTLVAEEVGIESGIESEMLAETVKSNLKSRVSGTVISDEREATLDGMKCTRFAADTTTAGSALRYEFFVAADNGAAYQLILFGPQSEASAVADAAEMMSSLFQRIDPSLIVHTPGVEPLALHESRELGYSVDLSDMGWRAWPAVRDSIGIVDFGALYRNDGALCIAPITFPRDVPPLETIAVPLLAAFEFEFPSTALGDPTVIQHHGLPGISMAPKREVDGNKYEYRFRIVHAESAAYLLAAWAIEGKALAAELDSILDRVKLVRDAPPLPDQELTEKARSFLADVLAALGRDAFEQKQYERATQRFARALACSPDSSTNLTEQLRCFVALDRIDTALETLERHAADFEGDLIVLSWTAYLNKRAGNTEKAEAAYTALFAGGHEDENDLLDFVNLFIDGGRHDDAIAQLETFLERRPSTSVRRWLASVHSRKGDHETAIEQFQAIHSETTFDAAVAYDLADCYLDASRPADAIDICEDLLRRGYDTPRTYQIRGRSELNLRWYRKAKLSFEKGLEKAPNDQALAADLETASGYLGEGNNSRIKTPIAPVEIPEPMLARIAAVKTSADFGKGFRLKYANLVRAVDFVSGAKRRTTLHREVNVLTAEGANEMSSLAFDFDPLNESIFVNKVLVRSADGAIVAKGSVDDYYVIDSGDTSQATHSKTLHVPVPGVRAGTRIEYAVTWESRGPRQRFEHVYYEFGSTVPVACDALVVRGSIGELRSEASPGVEELRGEDWIGWSVAETPQLVSEPMRAPRHEYVPIVRVTDARDAWEQLAGEYLQSIEDRLVLDDATRGLSRSLVADAETSDEKVRILARHVQKELTYKAIEFGRRGRIPNLVPEIIEDRYGDCKDHSLMLRQMLAAIDIDAHLGLVHTYRPVSLELPTMDAFNHMIVYVPATQGQPERFIDCTDKHTDSLAATPNGLARKHVLVLDPKKPRFQTTPAYPDPASTLTTERRVRLVEESAGKWLAKVTETLSLGGLYSGGMRRFLLGMEEARRKEAIDDILEDLAQVRVTALGVRGLDTPSSPLVLDLEYDVTAAFRVADGKLVGELPWLWERYYGSVDRVDSRATPFRISSRLRHTSSIRLQVPEQYSLGPLDWAARQERSSFVEWSMNAIPEGDEVAIEHELHLRADGVYPADAYESYCASMGAPLEVFSRPMILHPSAQ